MKVNRNFMLCEVAGETVVVPCGAAASDFHGMLRLNTTGAALWKMLENGAEEAELAAMLVKEFGADETSAAEDTADFLRKLEEIGCLE
ncbi:MAG: PqqD family protein [Oscillospiraceae bacterium]|nr:PqqD family protein [Oscillospiraceae bacterium]